MTSIKEKDQYFVAVKVLLRDENKLLIVKDIFKDGWDIPGGRLKPDEFSTPLDAVVERKVREELGPEIKYQLGEPKVFFRHERTEEGEADKPRIRIFAIGYEASYLGGTIILGNHHENFEWVSVDTFNPQERFTGGWCKGLEEYLEILKK